VHTGDDKDYSVATNAAVQDYLAREGVVPKIVLFAGMHNDRDAVAVAVGAGEKKSVLAELLFLDSLKILRYAESFGGVRYMPREQARFILNWEVEQFRERVSTG